MTMNFKANKREANLIMEIAKRVDVMAKEAGSPRKMIDTIMDLTACHLNGNPLDLDALLTADDFNLAHDVFGIERHLDHNTGKLTNSFKPRFSARAP